MPVLRPLFASLSVLPKMSHPIIQWEQKVVEDHGKADGLAQTFGLPLTTH